LFFKKNVLLLTLAEEVLQWDSTEEGSSAVEMTIAKEGSSVESRGRTSSASVNGRTFFRWIPRKRVLPWINYFVNFKIILY